MKQREKDPIYAKLPLMQTRDRIIQILADGRFHSGRDLGERLSLTRAAVWKQIRALSSQGVDVHSVKGKGYRLPEPIELLDHDRILAAIKLPDTAPGLSLEVLPEIDSTNEYLKRRPGQDESVRFNICLAERQSAGRGRRGRQWVSPYGANLYCSLAYRAEASGGALDGLSLAAGVGLVRAMHQAGVNNAGLKWPNDILLDERKLAGILVEIAGEVDGALNVIVGVGLNMRMPRHAAGEIDQPWTDLHSNGFRLSRNQLAASTLSHLIEALTQFSSRGLEPFLDDWQRFDRVAGRAIRLYTGDGIVTGTARGVDERGALKVEHKGGVIHYHSGEVSLRVAS
jgi:BirA family biotin operon repressor/biotin-[acetyl-CoA-carboxylase] ligase